MKALIIYLCLQAAIIIYLAFTAPKVIMVAVGFGLAIFGLFVIVTRWLGFGADSKKHIDQGG